ncbi:MAG: aliphatic sulfonate ABC transporter substrate-binding protein [Synergistaceae bacterium]|jgi:sulfonate transport system substrate-binding protein|nr:aliphatic sulfonate ABC transporter substrate-binding protein [Synergistaceae bacterium]
MIDRMKMRNKCAALRFVFRLLTLAVGVSVLGGYALINTTMAEGAEKKYEGLKIRWATQPSQTQAAIAEELGYFKEEFEADGVAVELRIFASGPPIIEAFAAGELDFGQVGNQPAIQAIANGIKIDIIAAYMTSDGSSSGLVARNDSGIKTLSDIRGRKVAYTVGTVAHQLLLKLLQSENLTENDLQLISLRLGDIPAALESGSIDAAVTWEPYLTSILEKGNSHLVVNGTGFPNSSSIIIGKKTFLEQYPELVVRLLKVLDRSEKWSRQHIDESVRLLSKRTGVAESAYRASFRAIDFSLYLDEQRVNALADTAEFLFEQGTIRERLNLKDFIDTSSLEKAGITK